MIEVESYRRLAEGVVGRKIAAVDAPDGWFLKRGLEADALAVIVGQQVMGARRIGKLLLLDLESCTLGLRFGMTGRLFVDGTPGVDALLYSSARQNPRWDRFGLHFEPEPDASAAAPDGRRPTQNGDEDAREDGRADGARTLRVQDPRRLGGVELDPDATKLGPDAAAATLTELRARLRTSTAPIKARLLDQSTVAGIGNLIVDEVLWRAGIDPATESSALSVARVRRLHERLRATIAELTERGGSHTGDLMVARVPGGRCPRDGTPLKRSVVGGRTTWSCPRHQR